MPNKITDHIVLKDVMVTREKRAPCVQVSLELNERGVCAQESIDEHHGDLLKAIAQATLSALSQLLPKPLDAKLEYIRTVDQRGSEPTALAILIRLREAGKESLLNGGCTIDDTLAKAAAQAVLTTLHSTVQAILLRQQTRQRLASGSDYDAVSVADIESSLAPSPAAAPPPAEPNEAAIDIKHAQNLAQQGQSAAMKGSHAQAAYFYAQAIALDANNARYHHELGLALSKLPERRKEAERALKQSIMLAPDCITYHLDLAALYKELGWPERAVTTLNAALALDSNNKVIKRELQAMCQQHHCADTDVLTTSSATLPTSVRSRGPRRRALTICALILVVLIGLTLAGLYISNLPARRGASVAGERGKQFTALEILQNAPAATAGLTVEKMARRYAKEQNGKYEWWSGREAGNKDQTQFLVMFIVKNGNGKEHAIWLVDVDERKITARNALAERLSGK